MENQLLIIDTNQLDEVVKNSGLAIIEGEEIKGSYLPFLNQLAEIQSQSSKINFENPTALDEEIAGKLRKATVKIRTGAEALKDDRNRMNLLKQKLEVASYKLIEASCKLTEEVFVNVEKAREIAEKKRKAELKVARDTEAQQYSEFIPFGIDLGNLDEAGYLSILNGAKLQLNAKIEEEKRIEAEKIEKERMTNLHLFRKESVLHLWNFMPEENKVANFGEWDSDMWNELVNYLNLEKKDYEKKQAAIQLENERLRKANEAKEKQRLFELAEAEKLRQKAELKAKQEKEAAEEKARIEREKARQEAESLRLKNEDIQKAAIKKQKEIEAKAAAEKKALQDHIDAENKRKEQAERDRIAAEKKAAAAPDRDKIIASVNAIKFELPTCKSESMQAIANTINAKFEGFKKWAIEQTNSL
jgi:membrane protein involved in colicin uptake